MLINDIFSSSFSTATCCFITNKSLSMNDGRQRLMEWIRKILVTSGLRWSQHGIAMIKVVVYGNYLIRLYLLKSCEWTLVVTICWSKLYVYANRYVESCLFCIDGNRKAILENIQSRIKYSVLCRLINDTFISIEY